MRFMPMMGIHGIHNERHGLSHFSFVRKRAFAFRILFIASLFIIHLCLFSSITYGSDRLIQYSFTIQNQTSDFITSLDFACFKPANTYRQKVVSITTTPPYLRESVQKKSPLLHFQIKNIAPFGVSIVRVSAKLEINGSDSTPQSNEKPSAKGKEKKGWVERLKSFFAPDTKEEAKDAENLKAFLLPAKFIESADPEIIALARSLRGKTSVDTARKLYEWVKGNIVYPGYAGNIKGALQTLKKRKGDCTGQAALFVALCRACNIPARPVTGFVCPNHCILNPIALHNWGEFWAKGEWHIADPQGGNFMEHESDYVEMECNSRDDAGSAEIFRPGCLDLVRFSVEGHAGIRVRMNGE